MTFWRAGARLKVSLRETRRQSFWGGAFAGTGSTPILAVEVRNRGFASAEVVSFWFEVDGLSESLVPLKPDGPPVPATLDGYHHLFWTVDRDSLLLKGEIAAGRSVKLRVRVQLGNGATRASKRISVSRGA